MQAAQELARVEGDSDGGRLPFLTRIRHREIYNNALKELPSPSYYIAQSCNSLESSNDSGQYGGEYISALIEKAKGLAQVARVRKVMKSDTTPAVISLSRAHDAAVPVVVQKTFNAQHPTFRGPKSKRPPFAVVL